MVKIFEMAAIMINYRVIAADSHSTNFTWQ